MPCSAHRATRFILPLGVLALTLAACKPIPGGDDVAAGDANAARQVPARAQASLPASPKAKAEHWQCGELLVDSQSSDNPIQAGAMQRGTMQLRFSGKVLALQRAPSPSGLRHADAAGNAFVRDGDVATLTLASGVQYECTRTDRASPWTRAAARGIAFRAVGSEPGWLLEIGDGGAPSLHATLDYGQRNVDIAQMHPLARGFTGSTPDGTVVTVEIERTPCRDGMSGESFEAQATLVVGETTYRGCGAYLSP